MRLPDGPVFGKVRTAARASDQEPLKPLMGIWAGQRDAESPFERAKYQLAVYEDGSWEMISFDMIYGKLAAAVNGVMVEK
ncbi:MAG: hypothetical protein PHF00_09635 [Elusimicrobia bacterium]|nr:hypothetical protein [Elusimicrobiota bacterium]